MSAYIDVDKIVGNGQRVHEKSGAHYTNRRATHRDTEQVYRATSSHKCGERERVSPSYESITVSDVEPLHRACDDVG